jgi:hypothetical protein
MKRFLLAGAAIGVLALINAGVDTMRTCQCEDTCWCKRPGLRHARWLVPVGHRLRQSA